jgi:hypothetical protein
MGYDTLSALVHTYQRFRYYFMIYGLFYLPGELRAFLMEKKLEKLMQDDNRDTVHTLTLNFLMLLITEESGEQCTVVFA